MKRTVLILLCAAGVVAAETPLERMFDTQLTSAQRNDACFELRGNAGKPVLEAMLRALRLDTLRACAGENLRRAEATGELQVALASEIPEERATAARLLGSFRKTELLEALAKAASDPNLLVATNAVDGMAQYETPAVYPYLEAIARKGGILGILALDRLQSLHDPAVLSIARRMLASGDVPDRVAAMRIVGESGDRSDLPALRAIAAEKEEVMVRQRGFGLMPAIDLSRAAKGTIAQIERRR